MCLTPSIPKPVKPPAPPPETDPLKFQEDLNDLSKSRRLGTRRLQIPLTTQTPTKTPLGGAS